MIKSFISSERAVEIYGDQFSQLADDATFLWLLYSTAINQPHYTRNDLLQLEERINAKLDALVIVPEKSWTLCINNLQEYQQAAECFVLSILAFRSLEVDKIQAAVTIGLQNPQMFAGLVAALAWLPGKIIHSWIKKFLISKDLEHKYLALAVCCERREDPKDYIVNILQREDCQAHEKLFCAALRLVGKLKRFDLLPVVRSAMQSDNKNVFFWANWSAVMMGDTSVAATFNTFVLNPNPHQRIAMDIALRALPMDNSRHLIGLLAKNPKSIRLAITATGILGDPQAIHWLIEQMRIPSLTRTAGEAFTFITGIDLETNNLSLGELPDLDDQLPNSDTNDNNVEMSEDENLPFPDVDKVAAIWQQYANRFVFGQRYFLGQPITIENLQTVYNSGYQRQRRAAAIELALLIQGQYLLNHGAKGINEE